MHDYQVLFAEDRQALAQANAEALSEHTRLMLKPSVASDAEYEQLKSDCLRSYAAIEKFADYDRKSDIRRQRDLIKYNKFSKSQLSFFSYNNQTLIAYHNDERRT